MKIPRELPRFRGKRALFIVAGKQTAQFYDAHGREVVLIDQFQIEKPMYSDKEGYFETRGHGEVYRSGSTYTNKDTILQKEFSHMFRERIHKINFSVVFDEVYLFVPLQLKRLILGILPDNMKRHIKQIIPGNFQHMHLTRLLKKLGVGQMFDVA